MYFAFPLQPHYSYIKSCELQTCKQPCLNKIDKTLFPCFFLVLNARFCTCCFQTLLGIVPRFQSFLFTIIKKLSLYFHPSLYTIYFSPLFLRMFASTLYFFSLLQFVLLIMHAGLERLPADKRWKGLRIFIVSQRGGSLATRESRDNRPVQS